MRPCRPLASIGTLAGIQGAHVVMMRTYRAQFSVAAAVSKGCFGCASDASSLVISTQAGLAKQKGPRKGPSDVVRACALHRIAMYTTLPVRYAPT